MTKKLSQRLEIEEIFLYLIKGLYKNRTLSFLINGQTLNTGLGPYFKGTRTNISTLVTSTRHSLTGYSRVIRKNF